jgi:hypothetical protein
MSIESHPFALCSQSDGPCVAPLTDGITGDNPMLVDAQLLTFLPPDHGPTALVSNITILL